MKRHLLVAQRKYSPSWTVRDLNSLRQVSALKTYPVPAKYREQILVSVWFEKGVKTTVFFKYREVHVAEFIVSVHEIVELMGTNIVR